MQEQTHALPKATLLTLLMSLVLLTTPSHTTEAQHDKQAMGRTRSSKYSKQIKCTWNTSHKIKEMVHQHCMKSKHPKTRDSYWRIAWRKPELIQTVPVTKPPAVETRQCHSTECNLVLHGNITNLHIYEATSWLRRNKPTFTICGQTGVYTIITLMLPMGLKFPRHINYPPGSV